MNDELLWVLGLLLATVVLFITGKVRMDVVALLVIVAFVLSGTLTLAEATAGFSDPNVLLIAALFVIGDRLVRMLLMVTVYALGAFMSSTGVVAIFIPVVLSVAAQRMKTPPGRLMMPLSFAGLISGMMTLVATPPNMVVNSELLRNDLPAFGFFAVTPIGCLVLVLGIGYMALARFWLTAPDDGRTGETWQRRTFRDLIRDYRLSGRARRLALRAGSPLIACLLMSKFRCIDMKAPTGRSTGRALS